MSVKSYHFLNICKLFKNLANGLVKLVHFYIKNRPTSIQTSCRRQVVAIVCRFVFLASVPVGIHHSAITESAPHSATSRRPAAAVT